MPFTPLAHDRLFLDEREWQPLIDAARKAVASEGGFEFRLASSWPEYAVSQVLALGGHWLCGAVRPSGRKRAVLRRGHARFRLAAARSVARRDTRGSAAEFVAEKPADHPFPLAFVRTPVDAATRYHRYALARDHLGSGPASATFRAPRLRVPAEAPAQTESLLRAKVRLKPLFAALQVPREAAGTSPEWLNAWALAPPAGPAPAAHRLPAGCTGVPPVRERAARPLSPLVRTRLCSRSPPGSRRTWSPRCGVPQPRSCCRKRPTRTDACGSCWTCPRGSSPSPPSASSITWRRSTLPVTARRAGAELRLEAGEKSQKRKVLYSALLRPAADGAVVELEVGPRFRLRRYLDLFPEPEVWRRALVQVLAPAANRPLQNAGTGDTLAR